MAPYSMDLRTRVLRDSDAGMASKEVALKYAVSRAWVDRVKQRRRETGEVAPRVQTVFRRRALTVEQEHRLGVLLLAQPDATLAELQAALPTTAALSTLWRAIARAGLTFKKNRVRGGAAAS
jgi:transposase